MILLARGVRIQLHWSVRTRGELNGIARHTVKRLICMVDRPSLAQLTGLALGNYHLQQLLEDTPWGPIYMASATDRKSYTVRFLKAATKLSRDARIIYAGLVQDEARRIQALRHPNILPLVDYGNHDGMPYLVYPHINFVSLRALVQKKVPNNLNVVSEYLQQIA